MDFIKHIYVKDNKLIIISLNDLEFTIGLADVITISIDQENDISCYQLNIKLHNNQMPYWLHLNSYSNNNTFSYGCLRFYHDPVFVDTLDSKKYLSETNPILSTECLDELDEFLCVDNRNNTYVKISLINRFSILPPEQSYFEFLNAQSNPDYILNPNINKIRYMFGTTSIVETTHSENENVIQLELLNNHYPIKVPASILYQCLDNYLKRPLRLIKTAKGKYLPIKQVSDLTTIKIQMLYDFLEQYL